MTEFYQVYYDEKQKEKLFPFSIPYYNPTLTIFFENKVLSDLVSASTADKIGVASWKLRDKMRIRVAPRGELTPEVLNSDYEVLSLTKNSKKHTMLAHLYHWHPKSRDAIALLWQKLGYKLCGEVKNPIYQNAYIGKAEIYKKYVNEFLNPAIDLIKRDQQLNELMMLESNYGNLNREADLKSVKAKLGINYFPLCPFILERCPSIWYDLNNVKITYL